MKTSRIIRLGVALAVFGAAGYLLRGYITDDTFIRMDITRFYLAAEPPRTPAMLAEWLEPLRDAQPINR